MCASLQASATSMSDLERLDVSFNYFSGEVPKEILSFCFNLGVLDLSTNDFHGQIFSEHSNNLTNLKVLNLNNNQFTRTISGVVSKCLTSSYCVLVTITCQQNSCLDR